MGEGIARVAGFDPTVVGSPATPDETTNEDTRAAVRAFAEADVDAILFVGGDGTAVDVATTLDELDADIPILASRRASRCTPPCLACRRARPGALWPASPRRSVRRSTISTRTPSEAGKWSLNSGPSPRSPSPTSASRPNSWAAAASSHSPRASPTRRGGRHVRPRAREHCRRYQGTPGIRRDDARRGRVARRRGACP